MSKNYVYKSRMDLIAENYNNPFFLVEVEEINHTKINNEVLYKGSSMGYTSGEIISDNISDIREVEAMNEAKTSSPIVTKNKKATNNRDRESKIMIHTNGSVVRKSGFRYMSGKLMADTDMYLSKSGKIFKVRHFEDKNIAEEFLKSNGELSSDVTENDLKFLSEVVALTEKSCKDIYSYTECLVQGLCDAISKALSHNPDLILEYAKKYKLHTLIRTELFEKADKTLLYKFFNYILRIPAEHQSAIIRRLDRITGYGDHTRINMKELFTNCIFINGSTKDINRVVLKYLIHKNGMFYQLLNTYPTVYYSDDYRLDYTKDDYFVLSNEVIINMNKADKDVMVYLLKNYIASLLILFNFNNLTEELLKICSIHKAFCQYTYWNNRNIDPMEKRKYVRPYLRFYYANIRIDYEALI